MKEYYNVDNVTQKIYGLLPMVMYVFNTKEKIVYLQEDFTLIQHFHKISLKKLLVLFVKKVISLIMMEIAKNLKKVNYLMVAKITNHFLVSELHVLFVKKDSF